MKARIEDGIVYSPYPEVEIFNCSFFEATKKACLTDPDKPALIDDSVTLTKSEFVARLRCYAAGLQRHGVQPGDRICVHVGNSVDNFVAMCSCLVAGASIVLAKPSLTERELRYQITDSDSTHLLVEPELAGKGLKVASELKLKGFLPRASPMDSYLWSRLQSWMKVCFERCPLPTHKSVSLPSSTRQEPLVSQRALS